MIESLNVRKEKTQQKLSMALIEELRHSPFNSITIGVICKKAGVTRATFYNSFDSLVDLTMFVIRNYVLPPKTIPKYDADSSLEVCYHSFLKMFLSGVIRNTDAAKNIISGDFGNAVFFQTIMEDLASTIGFVLQPYKEQLEKVNSYSLICFYLSSSILGIVYHELFFNKEFSLDDIVDKIYKLTFNGLVSKSDETSESIVL